MAQFFSIASDGIVRAHSKDTAALLRIRRGGQIQISGAPAWYSRGAFAEFVEARKERDRKRHESFMAHHMRLHELGTTLGWLTGCAKCEENRQHAR